MSDDLNSRGQNFQEWMADVDQEFEKQFGLTTDHFPDWSWHDAFDDDCSVDEAIENYREEMMGDF